jgi:hypothetical protein
MAREVESHPPPGAAGAITRRVLPLNFDVSIALTAAMVVGAAAATVVGVGAAVAGGVVATTFDVFLAAGLVVFFVAAVAELLTANASESATAAAMDSRERRVVGFIGSPWFKTTHPSAESTSVTIDRWQPMLWSSKNQEPVSDILVIKVTVIA